MQASVWAQRGFKHTRVYHQLCQARHVLIKADLASKEQTVFLRKQHLIELEDPQQSQGQGAGPEPSGSPPAGLD